MLDFQEVFSIERDLLPNLPRLARPDTVTSVLDLPIRIIGEELGHIILYAWDGYEANDVHFLTKLTFIDLYDTKRKVAQTIYTHPCTTNIVGASLNRDRSLLVFTSCFAVVAPMDEAQQQRAASKDENRRLSMSALAQHQLLQQQLQGLASGGGAGGPPQPAPASSLEIRYESFLVKLSPPLKIFAFNVSRTGFQRVHFVYGDQDDKMTYLLLFLHKEFVHLYHFPTGADGGAAMKQIDPPRVLARKFLWYQWDMDRQCFYLLVIGANPREAKAPIGTMIRCLQFIGKGNFESMIETPVPLQLNRKIIEQSEYLHLPFSSALPDKHFNMQVVHMLGGGLCVCHQHFRELSSSKDHAVLHYTIFVLHQGAMLEYEIPMKGIPDDIAQEFRLCFISAHDYLVCYIPGYYLQLIDCGSSHEVTYHLIFHRTGGIGSSNAHSGTTRARSFVAAPPNPFNARVAAGAGMAAGNAPGTFASAAITVPSSPGGADTSYLSQSLLSSSAMWNQMANMQSSSNIFSYTGGSNISEGGDTAHSGSGSASPLPAGAMTPNTHSTAASSASGGVSPFTVAAMHKRTRPVIGSGPAPFLPGQESGYMFGDTTGLAPLVDPLSLSMSFSTMGTMTPRPPSAVGFNAGTSDSSPQAGSFRSAASSSSMGGAAAAAAAGAGAGPRKPATSRLANLAAMAQSSPMLAPPYVTYFEGVRHRSARRSSGFAMFDCSRGIAYRFELDWDTVFDLFALSESPQLHMKAMHLVIAHMADTRPVKLLVDRLCAELPHRITPELLKEFLIGATHHMYMSREGADAALLRLLPMTTIPALVDEWGDEGATTRSTFTQEYAGLGFHYRTLKNVALGIKKESELSKKQSSMVGVGSSFEALRLLCLNSKQRRFSVERRLRRETSHVSSSSLFGSAPNSPASNNSGSANSQQPASPASVALQGGSSLSSSLVSAVTSFAHLSAAGNPGNNPANSPASSMRRFFARMFTPVAAVPDAVGSPTTEAMKDRGLLNSPREAHSKMASSAKDYTDVQQLQASQLFRLIVEARTEAFSPAAPLSATSSSDPTPDARSPSFAHLDSELASLSQSVSEHEALRSVETQDNDQITFELLEMLYCALEELEFPFPNNFIAKFGRLAYKCLDRFTFLQYVSRRTFVLTPDFVREILSTIAPNVGQYEIPSSPAPSDPSSPPALFPPASAAPSTLASREDADFAFRLISRLDPAPALKLLTEWKHPLATQYVTNLYSQSILSSQQLHADSSRSSFQPQGNNRASMQFGGDGFPGADGAPRPRHERTAEGNIIFLPSDYDPEVGMYNDGIANIDEAGGVDLGEAANDAFPIFRFIPLQLFLRQLARKDAMDGGDGSELRFVYEATRCLADVPRVVPSLAEHPDMLAAFADDGWRTATASTGRNSDDSEPNVTERQLRQRHIKQVQQQLLDELGASWCDKDDPSWIETQLLRESYLAISRTTSDASRLRAAQQ